MSTHFPLRRVISAWWPLAASWLFMSLEGPAMSAAIARLANPEIHLAAYGGVVFPLALLIESPIIMLLAASTALSKDEASYQKLWQFMMAAGGLLTILHALVAFTPLYYPLVVAPLGVPAEIVEPARLGLKIMLPWTWTIAYRRFNQGALIRFGRSQTVGVGTAVRLTANLITLATGFILAQGVLAGQLPGIAVGTMAIAAGVTSEALYAGWAVRPVRRIYLPAATPVQPPLTWTAFRIFYTPLVLTSLLSLIANPIGSAALSRMPRSLDSLAVWSVVNGVVFLLRSSGIALNEVVVALLDEAGAASTLRRFTNTLAAATTFLLLLMVATPLSLWWFSGIMGLSFELTSLARNALWLALPLPALSAYQSWFQGRLLNAHANRGISESVVIFLVVTAITLATGVLINHITGLYVGVTALTLATAAQTAWLGKRSRETLTAMEG